MSPPTEQLIRDYLNRLSVAARGQLGPDDRRALVNRTRDFIERKTGVAGPPTAIEVARLLAGLGDPAGLVDQERQRLAAVRGETPELSAGRGRMPKVLRRQPGKVRGASWHWPVQEPGRADLRHSLLDGGAATDSSRSAGESRPDSQAPDSQAPNGAVPDAAVPDAAVPDDAGLNGGGSDGAVPDDAGLNGATLDDAVPDDAVPDAVTPDAVSPDAAGLNGAGPEGAVPDSAAAGSATAGPGSGDSVRDGSEPAGAAGTAPLVPAEHVESDWFSRLSSPAPYPPPASVTEPAQTSAGLVSEPGSSGPAQSGGPAKPRWPAVVAKGVSQNGTTQQLADSSSVAPGDAPDQPDQAPAWQLMTAKMSGLARSARQLARAILAWARPRPLEATAVVLLGLGGVIYPPVWLLGASVALASRAWSYRDKWLGLAGPLLLTLIGTAVGVAAGGRSIGHDMHEGWMFAVVISRIAAALSAIYLAWRTVHVRRAPPVPPWSKPRKVG